MVEGLAQGTECQVLHMHHESLYSLDEVDCECLHKHTGV